MKMLGVVEREKDNDCLFIIHTLSTNQGIYVKISSFKQSTRLFTEEGVTT